MALKRLKCLLRAHEEKLMNGWKAYECTLSASLPYWNCVEPVTNNTRWPANQYCSSSITIALNTVQMSTHSLKGNRTML